MRPSMRGWVMSEQYHESMGGEGRGAKVLLAVEERDWETLSTGGGKAEETRLWLGIPKTGGKASIYKGRWKRVANRLPRSA
jgi:hypothetical protein